MQGRIIKGIAGFYYVYAEDSNTYACRAKGIFRLLGTRPLTGDYVRMEVTDLKDMEGSITEILPRKSELLRPNVANIDQALIVFSLTCPEPNFLMLDKLILQYLANGISLIICFNKEDLAEEVLVKRVRSIYSGTGFPLLFISALKDEGTDEVKKLLKGRTTSVAGPSGAGKSTLINRLQDNIHSETGSISRKSERGKQTTRHSEIIPVDMDTFIMDTPGFSSFELYGTEAEDLADRYPEFDIDIGCYFTPCSHTHEPGCAVKDLVEKGAVNKVRYENYVSIYEELKSRRRFR